MRHPVFVIALCTALLATACTDQRTESPTEPAVPTPEATISPTCSILGVIVQVIALVPKQTLIDAIKAKLANWPANIDNRTRKTAQEKALAVVDFILKAYYAGGLRNQTKDSQGVVHTPDEVKTKVITLINSLYCLLRLAPPPISLDDLGNGVVEVVGPTTDKAVITGDKLAGVDINPDDVPNLTTIVITRLPNSPPPLNTKLNQFPPFYHFSSTPEVVFNGAGVVAGICVEDQGKSLLLAHNVGTGVEILPFTAPSFLNCGSFALRGGGANAAWDWAKKILLPTELHATAAVTTSGVGGTTKKFSPFGAVEEGISFESFNYRFLDLGSPGTPPTGFQNPFPLFDDSGWNIGPGGFGEFKVGDNCSLIENATGTMWHAAVDDAHRTQIVLRKTFTVSTSAARIRVPVDNDVQVFVNGTPITSTGATVGNPIDPDGFLEHEFCPTREDAFEFQVSGLTPNSVNLLAILARDRGSSSYVDAEVKPFVVP